MSTELRAILQVIDALGLLATMGDSLRLPYLAELEERRSITFPFEFVRDL
jgi:hypothetical protein